MLSELHVRNFALIERADLEFGPGMTVLSGETGAGKSVLIDSINAALGAKAGKDLIRTGCESAYIELLFTETGAGTAEKLRALGITPEEDGTIILSRRILPNRSVFRLNDCAVTASALRDLTGDLIDIHGQHEHQTLLYPASQLKIVDLMAPGSVRALKKELSELYERRQEVKRLLDSASDASRRAEEAEVLRYEIPDLRECAPLLSQEEDIRAEYRRQVNASRITEALSEAMAGLDTDGISRAARALCGVAEFDPALRELSDQVSELDQLLSDAGRAVADNVEDFRYDEAEFTRTTELLQSLKRVKSRYGSTEEELKEALESREQRLSFLEHFEEEQERLFSEKERLEERLSALSGQLTEVRKETADRLSERIRGELSSLNFIGSGFEIAFEKTEGFGPNGTDRVEFLISTNPGEPMKALRSVASGGELSRIMLALKTVLASRDEIETMIFDEIDAGISGRTAQMVSEKLFKIGRSRQVFCITHLPQIAAMADHHFLIEKTAEDGRTRTAVSEISGEQVTDELSRLIGGTEITDGVSSTAREMKRLAEERKAALL